MVSRLEECTAGETPWNWRQVITADLRALLDAYRALHRTSDIWQNSYTETLLERDAARAEVDALKAENARAWEENSQSIQDLAEADLDLARASELLASCRAQSEGHLQARLEAERWMAAHDRVRANAEKTADKYALMVNAAADSRGALKSRFRRLARRYLGLLALNKHNARGSEYYRLTLSDAEQRVKELEAKHLRWCESHPDFCHCPICEHIASFDAPGGGR